MSESWWESLMQQATAMRPGYDLLTSSLLRLSGKFNPQCFPRVLTMHGQVSICIRKPLSRVQRPSNVNSTAQKTIVEPPLITRSHKLLTGHWLRWRNHRRSAILKSNGCSGRLKTVCLPFSWQPRGKKAAYNWPNNLLCVVWSLANFGHRSR